MTSHKTSSEWAASHATGLDGPRLQMLQMIGGKWVTAALSAAASLGIPARLKQHPKSVEALAQECRAHPEKLQRLLSALCSLNVLQSDPTNHYHLTTLGETLLPGELGELAEYAGRSFAWAPWAQLDASVQSDKSAFQLHHGTPLYPYLSQNEEDARHYDQGVDAFTQDEARALVEALQIYGNKTVLDLGGGQGSLLIEMLRTAPKLQGILFDLPEVVERAQQRPEFDAMRERVAFTGGDFTQHIPVLADIILLKRVLHNWDDAGARRILENARVALRNADARIVVIEAVLLPENFPDLGRLIDLEMMVMCDDGKERTKPALRRLLAQTGFRLEQSGSLPGGARWLLAAPKHP